jgi:Protein of unknwon function (DUF3008)
VETKSKIPVQGNYALIKARASVRANELLGMPAKSKKQQMAAGAALAAKRGEKSKSSLKGASRQMAESMSEKQLKDFAKTKRKSLPKKKRSK